MHEAVLLDAKLESWIAAFPPKLHPEEVMNVRTGSRRLVYSHHMVPVAWNMYRCGRMMLHEMRIRCKICLMKDYSFPCDESGTGKVVDLVRSLAEDICDSISFCLYETGGDGKDVFEECTKSKHAAACLLLWPLMVVKLGTYTTVEQKLRAASALERIGSEMGIKQASRLLRDRRDLFET